MILDDGCECAGAQTYNACCTSSVTLRISLKRESNVSNIICDHGEREQCRSWQRSPLPCLELLHQVRLQLHEAVLQLLTILHERLKVRAINDLLGVDFAEYLRRWRCERAQRRVDAANAPSSCA